MKTSYEPPGIRSNCLRNSQIGPYAFPVVRHEFTNWRDEQRSWRETCALFDQSHHMTDLYVEGPDALKVFSDLGVNTFKNFKVNQAKQFVACNHRRLRDRRRDSVLSGLRINSIWSAALPPPIGCNTTSRPADTTRLRNRDERSAVNQGRRKAYRYQVQGPHALQGDGEGNRQARAGHPVLQHGHVQDRGSRCPRSAPWHGRAARDGNCSVRGNTAKRCATRSSKPDRSSGSGKWAREPIPTSCLESGWIPSPLPAIYTGEEMKGYRQWLTAKSYEAMASLGGSFYSNDIADYYLTPYDLGYGPFVKFDHDFVGRAALEKMAANQKRKKVTLVWNGEDVERAFGTLFHGGGDIAKYIDLPLANYSTLPYDKVLKNGKTVGCRLIPDTLTTNAR